MKIKLEDARKSNEQGWEVRLSGDYEGSKPYFERAAKIKGAIARRMSFCFDKVLALQSAMINYALADNEAMADFYSKKWYAAHDKWDSLRDILGQS